MSHDRPIEILGAARVAAMQHIEDAKAQIEKADALIAEIDAAIAVLSNPVVVVHGATLPPEPEPSKARTDGARKTTASDCAHMETSLTLDERAEARSQAQVPEEYASRPVNGAWSLEALERYAVALRAMVASKTRAQTRGAEDSRLGDGTDPDRDDQAESLEFGS